MLNYACLNSAGTTVTSLVKAIPFLPITAYTIPAYPTRALVLHEMQRGSVDVDRHCAACDLSFLLILGTLRACSRYSHASLPAQVFFFLHCS